MGPIALISRSSCSVTSTMTFDRQRLSRLVQVVLRNGGAVGRYWAICSWAISECAVSIFGSGAKTARRTCWRSPRGRPVRLNDASVRPAMLGDVVISLPTARRQAKEGQTVAGRGNRRLLVHGILHLCGYDHERSKERRAACIDGNGWCDAVSVRSLAWYTGPQDSRAISTKENPWDGCSD